MIGESVSIDGRLRTVIGILPPEVKLDQPMAGHEVEALAPLDASSPWFTRGNRFLRVIARLKRDVSHEQAAAEMRELARSLALEHPETQEGWTVRVKDLRETLVGRARRGLMILLGAALFVLLVACANAANLLAVEAIRRRGELAIRWAMGADRGRLLRQLLGEGLPLVAAAGAGGLLIAWWLTATFSVMLPPAIIRMAGLGTLASMLTVATLVSVSTIFLIQLLPLLELSSMSLSQLLTEGSTASGGSRRLVRIRQGLVVLELTLALILLLGAGLMMKSFLHLTHVELGFEPARALTAGLELPFAKFDQPENARRFYDALFAGLRRDSRVQSVAVVTHLPLDGGNFVVDLSRETGESVDWQIDLRGVSPQYFETMGIPLLAGRSLTEGDATTAADGVVVNCTAARRLWGDQDPIGRRLIVGWGEPVPREVVGVVADVRHEKIDGPARPEAYVPYAQMPFWAMTLVVRSSVEPLLVADFVRRQVREVDQDVVIVKLEPLAERVASALREPGLFARLMLAFAAICFVLAAIGIYGVMARVVSTRARELGLRMALGARRWEVIGPVLRQGLRLVAVSILLGLTGAGLLSSFLASMLFEVSALDPVAFIAVPLAFLSVALVAILIPARKAVRVDPAVALRSP